MDQLALEDNLPNGRADAIHRSLAGARGIDGRGVSAICADYSRDLLRCHMVAAPSEAAVRPVFEATFREYGRRVFISQALAGELLGFGCRSSRVKGSLPTDGRWDDKIGALSPRYGPFLHRRWGDTGRGDD